MPIIHDRKLVFQHIPKTGGMALLDCLGVSGGGHQHLSYYMRQIHAAGLDPHLSFTVLRDPVERFRSAMAMYMYPPEDQLANTLFLRVRERNIDLFDRDDVNDSINLESVSRLCGDAEAPHFHSIISFICHRTDIDGITAERPTEDIMDNMVITPPSCVLQYERLDLDWQIFTECLGIEAGPIIKKVNASHRKPTFTDESIAAIQQMYRYDYQLINHLLSDCHVSLDVIKAGLKQFSAEQKLRT